MLRLVHLHIHTSYESLLVCVCLCRGLQLLAVVPKLCKALCSDVLAGVLDSSMEVGDKLMDGAFVLYCS